MQRTSDINVVETRALPSPAALLAELPKSAAQADFVTQARREIHRLIFTDDQRFLLIVGPCSIHDLDAGRDYARRLAQEGHGRQSHRFVAGANRPVRQGV